MGKSGASFCTLRGKWGKMHELGVTRSIVDVVLRNAQAQQAKTGPFGEPGYRQNAQLGRRMGAALFRPLLQKAPLPKAQKSRSRRYLWLFTATTAGQPSNLPWAATDICAARLRKRKLRHGHRRRTPYQGNRNQIGLLHVSRTRGNKSFEKEGAGNA